MQIGIICSCMLVVPLLICKAKGQSGKKPKVLYISSFRRRRRLPAGRRLDQYVTFDEDRRKCINERMTNRTGVRFLYLTKGFEREAKLWKAIRTSCDDSSGATADVLFATSDVNLLRNIVWPMDKLMALKKMLASSTRS